MIKGKVYLIGAGCGDADLITLRGLKKLFCADVVLYDSLVSKELTDNLPPECEKIAVGKRYNKESFSQDKINSLLIKKANEGKIVARLKGGDPYVFGRGYEEAIALNEAGINFEVIPGISSAIAAPALSDIPVTHRQVSRSFTVLTASTLDERGENITPVEFDAAVKLGGTIVILMGRHHIKEISKKLICSGMSADTPCAVIFDGCTDSQKKISGTIKNIADLTENVSDDSPAVIVAGKCAGFSLNSNRCCSIKAGICGTNSFFENLSPLLEKNGIIPVDLSFMIPVKTSAPLPNLKDYDWLVLTSPNGVCHFFSKLKENKIDIRNFSHLKLASIGPGTAKKLEEYGIYCDMIPDVYDSAHLGKKLAKSVSENKKILICRAKNGSLDLTAELEKNGCDYCDFALYELKEDANKKSSIFSDFPLIDYLIFGSASGVRAFFESKSFLPDENIKIVCIGEKTAQELNKYNKKAPIVAVEYSIEGLVKSIVNDITIKE